MNKPATTCTNAREHLIRALESDLIGPYNGDENEVLAHAPFRHYLTGFLAPAATHDKLGDALAKLGGRELDRDLDDDDSKFAGDLDGDDDAENEDTAKRREFFPSSMGMTFLVRGGSGGTLDLDVTWGAYTPVHVEAERDADDGRDDFASALVGQTSGGTNDQTKPQKPQKPSHLREWHRAQRRGRVTGVSLDVTVGDPQRYEVPDSDGLVFHVRSAATPIQFAGDKHEGRAISVFLVNETSIEGDAQTRAAAYVFQVGFEAHPSIETIARTNLRDTHAFDHDQQIADLQYRAVETYGVGHNVAVIHQTDDTGERTLQTQWLPSAEAHFVRPGRVSGVEVQMGRLAACDTAAAIGAALDGLPEAYRTWIATQRATELEHDGHRDTRDELMKSAEYACERIERGIRFLKSDAQRRRIFSLTNQAMRIAARKRRSFNATSDEGAPKRDRAAASRARRAAKLAAQSNAETSNAPNAPKAAGTDVPALVASAGYEPEWRLFQLAFLLMNIEASTSGSIASAAPSESPDKLVDVLYFPTGGGKTEAYLAVAAWTMLARRFDSDSVTEGGGVAVILRYTLRLLTLDQLERAAILICALEDLRADHIELGDTPFLIGQWVGSAATPNTVADALQRFTELKNNRGSKSPFPLARCPGCGKEIGPRAAKKVALESGLERINIYCDEPKCRFAERNAKLTRGRSYGIPVEFIDEQIYRFAPSFLIGTVDKFALIPLRERAGMLFGRVAGRHADGSYLNASDLRNTPLGAYTPFASGLPKPELIIQDEVHLISGPLGSMVGLYEFMVEELCREDGTKNGQQIGPRRLPRIIASTATVKDAGQQAKKLFGRENTRIFPPLGVEPDDTFFAERDETRPPRTYLGVGASGRALKKILKRVYGVLLGAANFANAASDRDERFPNADSYMSLLGYFNSLRELGGMRMIVDDEVHNSTQSLELRVPKNHRNEPHAFFKNRRISLNPMELTSRVSTAGISIARDALSSTHASGKAPDVALASNMISVGIDIERLGLMVVAGQPKSTSEYIQATSRVGRKYPGLVVTCYNVHRARDRSYFEHFEAFHSSFYRHVERTSVTPWAASAVDRALVAVLMGVLRHASTEHAHAKGVYSALDDLALRTEIVERLRARVDVAGDAGIAERAEHAFDRLATRAAEKHDEGGGGLVWGPWESVSRASPKLLTTALDDGPSLAGVRNPDIAPTSMRDVELSSPVWVDGSRRD